MSSNFFQTVKDRLRSGWGFMRLFRLTLGIFAGVQAVMASDLILGVFSGILLYQAVLNTGCCGVYGCDTNQVYNKQSSDPATLEDVTFKEVK